MTKQEFEKFQNELTTSEKTINQFCSEHSIPAHRYYYWRKRYQEISPEPLKRFTQIGPDKFLGHPTAGMRIEYPNGISLSFIDFPGVEAIAKLVNLK